MRGILKNCIVWMIVIINVGLCYIFIRMTLFFEEREALETALKNQNDIIEPLPQYDFLKKSTLEGNAINFESLVTNHRDEISIGDYLIYSVVMANKYGDSLAVIDFSNKFSILKGMVEEMNGYDNSLDSAKLFIRIDYRK